MKSKAKIIFEGICYTLMLGGPPWVDLYTRHLDTDPSPNEVKVAFVMAIVAVATGLKAFASSSTGDQAAMQAEVKQAVEDTVQKDAKNTTLSKEA